jgi:hypothetical protein
MMMRTTAAILGLAVALAAPYAAAQNPQAAPPAAAPLVAPPNAPSPPPEKIAPPGRDVHADNQTLSDKLSQQHGTLHPPAAVDPGMAVSPSPRQQGSMPVIPPPGSPGGNQSVVPK